MSDSRCLWVFLDVPLGNSGLKCIPWPAISIQAESANIKPALKKQYLSAAKNVSGDSQPPLLVQIFGFVGKYQLAPSGEYFEWTDSNENKNIIRFVLDKIASFTNEKDEFLEKFKSALYYCGVVHSLPFDKRTETIEKFGLIPVTDLNATVEDIPPLTPSSHIEMLEKHCSASGRAKRATAVQSYATPKEEEAEMEDEDEDDGGESHKRGRRAKSTGSGRQSLGGAFPATSKATQDRAGEIIFLKQASYPFWPSIVSHPMHAEGKAILGVYANHKAGEDKLLVRYFPLEKDQWAVVEGASPNIEPFLPDSEKYASILKQGSEHKKLGDEFNASLAEALAMHALPLSERKAAVLDPTWSPPVASSDSVPAVPRSSGLKLRLSTSGSHSAQKSSELKPTEAEIAAALLAAAVPLKEFKPYSAKKAAPPSSSSSSASGVSSSVAASAPTQLVSKVLAGELTAEERAAKAAAFYSVVKKDKEKSKLKRKRSKEGADFEDEEEREVEKKKKLKGDGGEERIKDKKLPNDPAAAELARRLEKKRLMKEEKLRRIEEKRKRKLAKRAALKAAHSAKISDSSDGSESDRDDSDEDKDVAQRTRGKESLPELTKEELEDARLAAAEMDEDAPRPQRKAAARVLEAVRSGLDPVEELAKQRAERKSGSVARSYAAPVVKKQPPQATLPPIPTDADKAAAASALTSLTSLLESSNSNAASLLISVKSLLSPLIVSAEILKAIALVPMLKKLIKYERKVDMDSENETEQLRTSASSLLEKWKNDCIALSSLTASVAVPKPTVTPSVPASSSSSSTSISTSAPVVPSAVHPAPVPTIAHPSTTTSVAPSALSTNISDVLKSVSDRSIAPRKSVGAGSTASAPTTTSDTPSSSAPAAEQAIVTTLTQGPSPDLPPERRSAINVFADSLRLSCGKSLAAQTEGAWTQATSSLSTSVTNVLTAIASVLEEKLYKSIEGPNGDMDSYLRSVRKLLVKLRDAEHIRESPLSKKTNDSDQLVSLVKLLSSLSDLPLKLKLVGRNTQSMQEREVFVKLAPVLLACLHSSFS
jgi:PWWP domain